MEREIIMSKTLNTEILNAIDKKAESLYDLRDRISRLLEPLPIGTVLRDEVGNTLCRIVPVVAGSSQWGNDAWDYTMKGRAAVVDNHLLCEWIPESEWDGSNMHHRNTGTFPECDGYENESDEYKWLSGIRTRHIANMLTDSLTRYIDSCRGEKEANDKTLPESFTFEKLLEFFESLIKDNPGHTMEAKHVLEMLRKVDR